VAGTPTSVGTKITDDAAKSEVFDDCDVRFCCITLLPIFCKIRIDFDSFKEMVSQEMVNLSKLLLEDFLLSVVVCSWPLLFSLFVFCSSSLLSAAIGCCIDDE
jgi:hypothetical protein